MPSEGWRGTFHPVTVQVGERPEGPLTTPARATSGRSRLDDLLLWGGIAIVALLTLLTAANRAPYPPLLFALIVAIAAAAFGVHAARGALRRARMSLLATLLLFLASLIAAATAASRVPPEPRLGYLLLTLAIVPTFGWIAWLTSDAPTRLERRSVWLDIAVLALSVCAIVIGIAGDALDAFLDVGDTCSSCPVPRSSSRSRRSAPSRPPQVGGRSGRWPRATSSRLASAAWASRDCSWRWVSTTPSSAWAGG